MKIKKRYISASLSKLPDLDSLPDFGGSQAGNHDKQNQNQKAIHFCIAFQVARPGFEPRQSEPKSDVLPLYYRASYPYGDAKIGVLKIDSKF
jgi:hypothetical protein